MGFGDIFKANENKQLKDRIAELEAMLTPEQQQILNLRDEISGLEQTISQKRRRLLNTQTKSRTANSLLHGLIQKLLKNVPKAHQLMKF